MQLLKSDLGTVFRRHYLRDLLWHLYGEAAESGFDRRQPMVLLFLLCFKFHFPLKCLPFKLSDLDTTQYPRS